jgi:hypothetical protein
MNIKRVACPICGEPDSYRVECGCPTLPGREAALLCDNPELAQVVTDSGWLSSSAGQEAAWSRWPLGLPLPDHAPAWVKARLADVGRAQ